MRFRSQKFFAALGVFTLGAAGMLALAPAAVGADTLGPVSAAVPDGDAGSLRDVLENQAVGGDTVVLEAGATYQLTCDGGGALFADVDLTVQGNGTTILQTCDALVWDVGANLTLDGVTITGGNDVNDRPAGGIHFDGEELIITNSSIVGNATCGDGGGINMDGGDLLHIENSTIAGNSAGQEGGAIASHSGSESVLEIVNSTISGNNAAVGGGIWMHDGGPVQLVYATIAGNATDTPGIACASERGSAQDRGVSASESDVAPLANDSAANIEFGDTESVLTTFGSVVALPVEGPNCNVGFEIDAADALANTASNGYNLSDDASCGLTGTGDREKAGDPMLGALAGNGGPTMTRLPAEGSPLIDGVPLASCQAGGAEGITTDQRGVVRPQRTGCDIGAVEVVAITPTPEPSLAVIVTPRFTG